MPDDVDALLALPGIGDYTARAVAVFAYGGRHPVVDTNIRRVIARAVDGEAEPGPPSARRDLAAMESLLPDDRAASVAFNAGMMELGAIVCTARAPRCDECPMRDACAWRLGGLPGLRRSAQGRAEEVRGLGPAGARAGDGGAARVAHPGDARRTRGVWPDEAQRERALAGLVADGLAVETGDGWLP